MFAVYDQHEDAWIDRRCRLTIDGLLRLHSSGRPYQHQELDTAARMLITTAGELFRVSQDRANQTERGDRPES
ncbi:hypothetical protein BAY61_01395 [Prauserella marina]|nr:hypothetical protein BAY61_01395 [Prauserella marina]